MSTRNPRTEGSRLRSRVARAFPRLNKSQVAAIAEGARTQSFTIGETVMREGTFANGFYVVVSGQADVSQLNEEGNDVKLRGLRPGDFFGEIGLLNPPRRTATVRARTRLVIAAIDRDQFFALMLTSAPTAASVAAAGAKRLAHKRPATPR